MKKEKPFRLYGIFGCPLAHTLSPAMQEAAFAKTGVKAFYLPLELSLRDFRKTMKSLQRLALEGFNLTVPYKETVIPFLGRLEPEARALGAVNTVYKRGSVWSGANTDVYGFLTSLKREGGFDPKGKNALVFGAGGAARAVVYALASSGAAAVWVTNRNLKRAEILAGDFKKRFPRTLLHVIPANSAALGAVVRESDLLVNATSVGLKKDEDLLPESLIPEALTEKKLFFDLIYHRPMTGFLKAGRKKGHRVLGGLGMLLHQGAKAFEYWTGKKAPVELMRKALAEKLAETNG